MPTIRAVNPAAVALILIGTVLLIGAGVVIHPAAGLTVAGFASFAAGVLLLDDGNPR